jgi:hypothetical protein
MESIEKIDAKINKELDSLRGVVETFLKNPEPQPWIPPKFARPSDREFLTKLQIPSYRRNGVPSLLFHNLDRCNDEQVEMVFGPSDNCRYVVIS